MSKGWLDNIFKTEDDKRQKADSDKERAARSAEVLEERWGPSVAKAITGAADVLTAFNDAMTQRRPAGWKPLTLTIAPGAFSAERERPFASVSTAFDSRSHQVIIRFRPSGLVDRELITILEAKGNYNTGDLDFWIIEKEGVRLDFGKQQLVTDIVEFSLRPLVEDVMNQE